MSHQHNAECEELHKALGSLIAELDVAPTHDVSGATMMPLAEQPNTSSDVAAMPGASTHRASISREIETIRQTLAEMECDAR